MAHRTNVIQVVQSFTSSDTHRLVKDPICGNELEMKDCKSIIFREEQTIYFCSKSCKIRYLSQTIQPPSFPLSKIK